MCLSGPATMLFIAASEALSVLAGTRPSMDLLDHLVRVYPSNYFLGPGYSWNIFWIALFTIC